MKRRTKNSIKLSLVALFVLCVSVIAVPPRMVPLPWLSEKLAALKVNLGLDLQGGIHLEYAIDLSGITDGNHNGTTTDEEAHALDAVQAVVERRVNAFGVGEPIVQRITAGSEQRLVVELPGLKDIEAAKSVIKETPFLDFREDVSDNPDVQKFIDEVNAQAKKTAQDYLAQARGGADFARLATEHSADSGSAAQGGDLGFVAQGTFVAPFDDVLFKKDFEKGTVYPELVETQFGWHIIKKEDERTTVRPKKDALTGKDIPGETEEVREVRARHILVPKRTIADFPQLMWKPTQLTGAQLESADYNPGQATRGGIAEPSVLLNFNDEGTKMFADITKGHIGERFAIFVDDELVSAPVIQAEITNGQAQITGNFTPEEAKKLAARLNEGALPVPITLVSQQSVDASLGAQALHAGLTAGAAGLALTMLYMVIYYRFFGLVAAVALMIYAATVVAIFKLSGLLPGGLAITLTLSGIAGFILSVGMAVDANILIFERIKEERRRGKTLRSAVAIGFERAWPSIRDGNVSTLLICVILIGVGSGFVQGFAIILFIGVVVSMFTAVVLVKTFLRAIAAERLEKITWLIGA